MTKLTITLSTYNHEEYVRMAIESILAQEVDFEYELLVIDDCSTDKTQDIILEYVDKFDNVKLLFNKKNYGAMFTSRMGKFFANSEYITRLEGDDYWTDPNKISQQIKILDENLDLVGCAHNTELYYEKEESGKLMIKEGSLGSVNKIDDLIDGTCYFHTSSLVWRNVFKEGYPKELFYNEKVVGDWFMSMLYAQHGDIYYIDKVMSCYRITGKGVWSSMSDFDKAFSNLLGMKIYDRLLKYKYKDGFARIVQGCLDLIWSLQNSGQRKSLLLLKAVLLKGSIDNSANYKFSRRFKSNILKFLLKPVDMLIIKISGFLLGFFFLFDVNRYYIYYRVLFYRFFGINIYREVKV